MGKFLYLHTRLLWLLYGENVPHLHTRLLGLPTVMGECSSFTYQVARVTDCDGRMFLIYIPGC